MKELSVSNIEKPGSSISNTKNKKSRSFRNESGNNDTDNDTDEKDDPINIANEEEASHYYNESEQSTSSSSSLSPPSSSLLSSKSINLKNIQKNMNIKEDKRFSSTNRQPHNDNKDCHCRDNKMDQTPPHPSLLLQQQETNHPSLTKPKQTSMRRAASSSLSPRRHRPQTSVINKMVRQRPAPGAHPVAGMRASELNAYRRSSLGSRITSFTRSHRAHKDDDNHSSTSSEDDHDDDYNSDGIFEPSDGIFEHDEEIGFTTSTRTITSEGRRSLSFISHRSRRRQLSSIRSIHHGTIPIHMEHVTILGSNNESIVGSWAGRDGDGSTSSSSTSKSSSSSSSTSLMVDSDDSNGNTSDETIIITPVQVKGETTFDKYRHWQTTTKTGRLCFIVCMLLACALIVISIAVPTLAQRKSQNQISDNNHLEESRRQHDPLRVIQTTLIEQGAVTNETALLKDVLSIEYETVVWLAFEDPQNVNATTNPERLVQRYTARFLSIMLLERPGLVNTTKLLVQPDDEEEEDGASTTSSSAAAVTSEEEVTNYLNISQHECLWSVQKIDMGPSLQLEHDQMSDLVNTDDDVIVAEISDADNTPTTAVTTLGQPIHQEKEIVKERQTNFIWQCNSQQQVTKLSLEQVMTLPSSDNLAVGSSSLVPVEIGNLIHLQELHLMEIYLDETNQMPFFSTTTMNDVYNCALPNLTILEIDMILTNDGESNQQPHNMTHNNVDVFEGIEHVMPNLSVLKLNGGIAPILQKNIAKLSNLTELSIQQFFNIHETEAMSGESLFFNSDFFKSFQSKNTLQKLDISQTHWTIPTNLDVLLPNLTHLKCSETQLTTTPDSIMDLKHLTQLDLSYNYLQSFPLLPLKSFNNKLEYLDLSYNDLRGTVDMDLTTDTTYSKLTFLNLEGNPQLNGTIVCPSQDIEIRVPPSMACSCCSSSSSSSPSLMSSPPNISQLLEKRNRHRLHSST